MNKKLKIYCTLFVVAIIILALTSTFHYSSASWSSDPEEKMELVESAPEFMSNDTLANGEVVTKRHPYIGYDKAKAISNFQRLYGPITDMEQLRATTIFTDEELEKLQNYIF